MINWNDLGFEYTDTDYIVRCSYHNGEWGKLVATRRKEINLHVAATVLQYGQEAFEGLKAVRGIDGKVRIFRMLENCRRLARSCEALYMAPVPEQLFEEAILLTLKKNIRYLPPYGSGASLYFRPMVICTTPRLGVGPGWDYEFIVYASPIGTYFKGGFHSTPFILSRRVDRAAPYGTGQYKVGGNYAAAFRATEPAHERGCGSMFLDSRYHRFIDECGAANFFGIKPLKVAEGKRDNEKNVSGYEFVTPRSLSILPSITNDSLMTIATDAGMKVSRRRVPLSELREFTECAACGTASVVSPISKVIDEDRHVTYNFSETPGPVCSMLYNTLLGIMRGELPDKYNWCLIR
ncbi:MAG: branched-chain amino acid aminotransferase [Paludibacteraceae bacterium]|nr:branched-chain amino acid aminotransferase [Paludibacteraceae bacterium]